MWGTSTHFPVDFQPHSETEQVPKKGVEVGSRVCYALCVVRIPPGWKYFVIMCSVASSAGAVLGSYIVIHRLLLFACITSSAATPLCSPPPGKRDGDAAVYLLPVRPSKVSRVQAQEAVARDQPAGPTFRLFRSPLKTYSSRLPLSLRLRLLFHSLAVLISPPYSAPAMPATTEASPPPPKLSRYRTIRGRNVPESRRYVGPEQKRVAGDDSASHTRAPPPNPALPPAASKTPGDCLVQPVTPISPRALVGPNDLALEARSAIAVPLRSDGSLDSGLYATHVASAASAAGIMSDEEGAQRDADAEMLLAEQKRKDLERLQLQLENHRPVALPPRSTARDKFSFLSRRRGQRTAAKDALSITAFSKTSTSPSKQSKPTPVCSDNTVTISQTQTSAEQSASYQKDASSAPDSETARVGSVP